MENDQLVAGFMPLSTPLIADACVRLKIPLRAASPGIHPIRAGMRAAGMALPARHRGSVDVFLEAMMNSNAGDVLVIDNQGRTDESCIGDLTVLEARANHISALVVRGLHRDTPELLEIGFPVFSYGSYPLGPMRLDRREDDDLVSADWGDFTVSASDAVFADDDGVIFVAEKKVEQVLEVAGKIRSAERSQADLVKSGKRLREQLDFDAYIAKRAADPTHTFRKHLRERGGAIEE